MLSVFGLLHRCRFDGFGALKLRVWCLGLTVASMVHGLGRSTTSGSKIQTTIVQYSPHAAPPSPSQHNTPRSHSYRALLGVDVCVCRQERLDRRVLDVADASSRVQRRYVNLRRAPPRQPSPLRVVSSAACVRYQPSERRILYLFEA